MTSIRTLQGLTSASRSAWLAVAIWITPLGLLTWFALAGFPEEYSASVSTIIGVVGVLVAMMPIFAAIGWKAWIRRTRRRLALLPARSILEETRDGPPWWSACVSDAARIGASGGRLDARSTSTRIVEQVTAREIAAPMVSVLVILGIVFTFQGIKKASDGLHKALSISAVSPELPDQEEPGSAERHGNAIPVMGALHLPKPATPVSAPQLQSEALQASIAQSLGPLQSAFGANLYGIVFAIAILSLLGLQRHLSRIIEDDVDSLVHGELADKVNELARKALRKRKSQRLLATSSIDARLRQLSDGMAALVASASGQQRAIEGIGDTAARRLSESVAPVLAAQLTPLLEAQRNALEAIAAATQGTAAQVANALAGTLKAQLTKVYNAESEHMLHASESVAASLGRVDDAQRLLAAATLSFAEIFHAGLAGHEEALALSLNANATAADALREARSSWAANLSLTDDLFTRTSTIVDRLEAVARHVDEASTITGEGVTRMAAALGNLQQLSQELAPAAGGLKAAAQELANLATSNAGQVVSAIGQASAASSQAASQLAAEMAAVGSAVGTFGIRLEAAGREGAEDGQRAMNQTVANMANAVEQAAAFLNQSTHVGSRLVEAAEMLASSISAMDHLRQRPELDRAESRAELRPLAFTTNADNAESADIRSRNPNTADLNSEDS